MKLTITKRDLRQKGLFIIFVIFLLFIKTQYPHWIKTVYAHQSFGLLNAVAGTQGHHPLEFYLGRIQDAFFGPLVVLASILLFLVAGLRFFKEKSMIHFALVVFSFFLIIKFEVLFFPPYGELVAGPYAEATWLHDHDFNYSALVHEKNFSQGGPKVYLTSIYPTLVAVLMKISPTPRIFLILNHLFIFLWAAFVVALLREILRKQYDDKRALLVVCAVMALPVFQCMVEMLHMEMMAVFFAMLAAYFLIQKKVAWASVMAVLSAWSKGTAGFVGAAVLFICITLFFTEKDYRRRWSYLLWGLFAVVFSVIKLLFWRLFIHKVQPAANALNFLAGVRPLWSIAKAELILFIISLVAVFVLYLRERKSERLTDKPFFMRHYTALVMFVFAGMWFGLFLNVSVMAYRYELLLLPFLAFCLFFAANIFIRSKKIILSLLMAIIMLSSIGSYGLFHRKKYPSSTYSYHKFERSLEYRNDLRLHMHLAKELEENFSGFTIGAPFVVAQKLALANLGYVKKPLDVVIYGMPCTYGGIKNFRGLQAMNIPRTIWVGFRGSQILDGMDFPIDPQDRVLKEIIFGDKKVVLFVGGLAIEKMRLLIEMSQQKAFNQKIK